MVDMKNPVVFTDLDETLLERKTYSFEKALDALALLREKKIPLVIVSSKTRSEIELCRKRLQNGHPFVSENGGGIFIPHGYFKVLLNYPIEEQEGCDIIALGTPYSELRIALEGLRDEGFRVTGFGDMTHEEIRRLTGLSHEEARMALKRYFDEPFTFDGVFERLAESVTRMGLRLAQGRFFHLTGANDKGRAVEILTELYKAQLGEVTTIALGDSNTDAPMLRKVDYPVLVQKDDGTYDENVTARNLIKAEGIGPEGWNKAVTELLG
jgi:mannosyl-3-phosphoglycerate phosphatase